MRKQKHSWMAIMLLLRQLFFSFLAKSTAAKTTYAFPLGSRDVFRLHSHTRMCVCVRVRSLTARAFVLVCIGVCVCLFDCERHSNSSKTQIRQRRRSSSSSKKKLIAVEWSNWTPCVWLFYIRPVINCMVLSLSRTYKHMCVCVSMCIHTCIDLYEWLICMYIFTYVCVCLLDLDKFSFSPLTQQTNTHTHTYVWMYEKEKAPYNW